MTVAKLFGGDKSLFGIIVKNAQACHVFMASIMILCYNVTIQDGSSQLLRRPYDNV